MRALSLRPPISTPFTSPMRAPTARATTIAHPIRASACSPTPTMIMAASVKVPGTLRSMPPVMITSIWPRAVMPRSAPNGAMAERATPPSVAGAQIAATTTSRTSAR